MLATKDRVITTYALIAILTSIAGFYLATIFVHLGYIPMDDFVSRQWSMTQVLVSYTDFGFIKRGLVGSVRYTLFGDTSNGLVIMPVIWTITAIIAFGVFMVRSWDEGGYKSRVIMLGIISCTPIGFMNLTYDFGRTDPVLLLGALSSLLLIERREYFIASVISCLMLLTHEIYALVFMPTLLAIVVCDKEDRCRCIEKVVSFCLLPAIVFIALLVFGDFNGSPSELSLIIENKYSYKFLENVGDAAPEFVWTRDLWGNILFTIGWHNSSFAMSNHVVPLLVFAVTVTLYSKVTRASSSLIVWSPLMIFPLFLIGVDTLRWFTLINFNMIMIMIHIIATTKIKVEISSEYFKFTLALLFLSLFYGPAGVGAGVPIEIIPFIMDNFVTSTNYIISSDVVF
ncbi:membrane hypothetical protein [Vibrio chagasii]|nr:membrane hypothetical protein [Vibrio chagasii]